MLKIKEGQPLPTTDLLLTPSASLNAALGGGLRTRSISLFWGPPGAGKSTLAQTVAGMNPDYKLHIFENEPGAYTDEWMDNCGIKPKNRVVYTSAIAEEIAGEALPVLRTGEKSIILVDSISNVILESTLKEDDGNIGIGTHSRAQKYLCVKMNAYMHENVKIIFIAQQSTGISQVGGFIKPNIGWAMEHYASNIVKVFASKSAENMEVDKANKMVLGQEVTWTIQKSRQGREGMQGHYWFDKVTGHIDPRKELFVVGVNHGVIHKGGAWYTYNDQKFQGEKNFIDGISAQDWKDIEAEITRLTNG